MHSLRLYRVWLLNDNLQSHQQARQLPAIAAPFLQGQGNRGIPAETYASQID